MSKSTATTARRSRTTYNPFTHPKFAKTQHNQAISISIEVMPTLTLEELRALYEAAIRQPLHMLQDDEGRDQTAWKYALSTEISRCTPKPAYMKRQVDHPSHPTQHARIDPEQLKALKSMLRPETLRRTFISIKALMTQIQLDIAEKKGI